MWQQLSKTLLSSTPGLWFSVCSTPSQHSVYRACAYLTHASSILNKGKLKGMSRYTRQRWDLPACVYDIRCGISYLDLKRGNRGKMRNDLEGKYDDESKSSTAHTLLFTLVYSCISPQCTGTPVWLYVNLLDLRLFLYCYQAHSWSDALCRDRQVLSEKPTRSHIRIWTKENTSLLYFITYSYCTRVYTHCLCGDFCCQERHVPVVLSNFTPHKLNGLKGHSWWWTHIAM